MAEWVGREILPHERDLRAWLGRRLVAAADVEDVVQECYCAIAQLSDVSHIEVPRAYLFTMARNLAQRQHQRARVVRLGALDGVSDPMAESDHLCPERIASARQELQRVQAAISTLSDRARRIFIMRRMEGLTQKEIAQRLGITETIVENEASRSLRAILKFMVDPAADDAPVTLAGEVSHVRAR